MSETKADMLYQQLSLKDHAENKYQKMHAITTFLENNNYIGTVDNPRTYFRGILPMRWGPFNLAEFSRNHPTGIVYFYGQANKKIVWLGGSMRYVVGRKGISSLEYERHTTIDVVPLLLESIKNQEKESVENPSITIEEYEYSALEAVMLARRQVEGQLQRLEFLATKLIQGSADGYHVLLGTPLYVALAD